MKFVKITENEHTKVMLDLETLDLLGYKLDSEDVVCVFEGTRDFDFTIVNEFLDSLNEPTLRRMVRILINMRRCIANCGRDELAADEYVSKLKLFMQGLFDSASLSPTENLFGDLYDFSAKYTTSGQVDSYAKTTRQMHVAASLLSALNIMVIHDFETHFTDVSEPLQILYPVFEEAIRDCGVDGAKDFVERNRNFVSHMDDDPASWILEAIYINDYMLYAHGSLPVDMYVIENYTQRILSSKMYVSSKRIREVKKIDEAIEQQRMENNETKDATSKAEFDNRMRIAYERRVADIATITALMIKQVVLDRFFLASEFCDKVVKRISKFIAEINADIHSHSELLCYNPLSDVEKIVDYVYNHIDYSGAKITAPDRPYIRDKMQYDSLIKSAITDGVNAIRRLSDTNYIGDPYAPPYAPKYTSYKALDDKLRAYSIIVPRLNTEYGCVINALINASDNIDVSQLLHILPLPSAMYSQYPQPIMQQMNCVQCKQGQPIIRQQQPPFTQNEKDSTKEK